MNVEPGSHVFILQSHQIRDSSSDSALHEEGVGNLFYLVSFTVTRISPTRKKTARNGHIDFQILCRLFVCSGRSPLSHCVLAEMAEYIHLFLKKSRTVELFKVWRILTTRIVKKTCGQDGRRLKREKEREPAARPKKTCFQTPDHSPAVHGGCENGKE